MLESVGEVAEASEDAEAAPHSGHHKHAGGEHARGLSGEWWFELFYDLVFVAAVMKMGGVVKDDLEEKNLSLQFLLFSLLWSLWFELERYMTRYHKADQLHLVLYLLQGIGVVGFSMNISTVGDMEAYQAIPDAIAQSLMVNKICLILLYLTNIFCKFGEDPNVPMIRRYLPIGGFVLGIILYGSSIGQPLGTATWLWTFGWWFEALVNLVETMGWPGEVDDDEEHQEHTMDRHGCFTMLILGEAVIQLIYREAPKTDYSHYVVATFAGVLSFNLAVLHFDTANERRVCSAMMPHGKIQALIWVYLHLLLTWCILLVGVGIKAMFYYRDLVSSIDDSSGGYGDASHESDSKLSAAAMYECFSHCVPAPEDEHHHHRHMLGAAPEPDKNQEYTLPSNATQAEIDVCVLGCVHDANDSHSDAATEDDHHSHRHLLGGGGCKSETSVGDLLDDFQWLLTVGAGMSLIIMAAMRYMHKVTGFRKKRLLSYLMRIGVACLCFITPSLSGIFSGYGDELASLAPVCFWTLMLVIIDIRKEPAIRKSSFAQTQSDDKGAEEGGGVQMNGTLHYTVNPSARER
eukprot:CAMPEP_0170135298 /NCGR_PEP_ID=MMETSP0033_2-20121228/2407_1 /TAXON_ID=195969 /ORGANISM="Dolichomastix tenuilepis, Strain CCMP3274" /LENGTH=574 /DNA_ID=CAMNT_0010370897 /DNA_START=11 /DNA_END=1732 /DNA_ORIENTATION=-